VSSAYNDKETSLWRLAMTTVARTVLLFTLPYLLAYYSVIGAWQGIRMLMLWLDGAR
jgi:hypothetical protein